MIPKVPIGPSTVAGYSVTVTGVVLAILSYLQGDHSQQTLGVLTAGAVALVSFAITQIGRYVQASRAIGKGAVQNLTFTQPKVQFGDSTMPADLSTGLGHYSKIVYGSDAADDDPDPEPEATDVIGETARHLPVTLNPPPDVDNAGASR